MSGSDQALPRPNLSVLDGVAIMVGVIVGIGIFKTPPLIAANVGSEAAFMGVWLLGGFMTLIGALCYAELATAYPNAGGEYHFLNRAYGRGVSLFFAWARGTVMQTGAITAVAFVFGDYANQLLPLGPHGPALYAGLSVIALTGLNLLGTPQSKRTQVVLTAITILALAVISVTGMFSGMTGFTPNTDTVPSTGGALGMAMILVLLTYGGWNEAAYLSAEIRNGRRSIVSVLVIGTLTVVLLYGIVNFAYLSVFGLENLRATDAVAADFMRLVVGDTGAIVLSLVIGCAALSTLNATIFTGARVYYALGRDLPALERLGMWDARGHNPANAILLQGGIALALVAFGAATRDGFQSMVDYTAPVFWFFMLLIGIALMLLRWREPNRQLPFRVPLYPLTPILFCLTCAYLLYSSIAYTGLGALVGIAVLLAGAPLLLLRPQERATVPAE